MQEYKTGNIDPNEAARKARAAEMAGQKRVDSEKERLERKLNINVTKLTTRLNEHIAQVRGQYQLWSVVLPPIPPLLIAGAVFFVRRIRESGGVPTGRRKR